MVGAGACLLGISLLPQSASLLSFFALLAAAGFFCGVFVGVWNPLLSDVFGPARFRSVYSQSMLLSGLVHLGAPTGISALHSAGLVSTFGLMGLLGAALVAGGAIVGGGFLVFGQREALTREEEGVRV